MNKTCDITNVVLSGNIIDYVHKTKYLGVLLCSDFMHKPIHYYVTFVVVQMMLNVSCFVHFATICIVPHYDLTLLHLAERS